MKQFFSTLFLACFLSALSAQTPLYIQFDPSCMYQLEYQYTYSGQDLLMYSINKGENELYFFKIGGGASITTTAMPKGTVSCQSVALSSSEVNSINAGGRLAYIVHKVQNGWLSMPVDAAGQIFRAGTSYVFRSPHYDFLLDTTNIDYARNLSQPGVTSPVYLTGMRDYDCRRQYAFRLEPLSADLPRMDIELIPGIGLMSNRTGRNGSEMEQNVYRLLKINGIGMEEFITALCRRGNNQSGNPGSFITGWNPEPAGHEHDPYVFTEPDKEGYYAQQQASSGNQPLANCPEKPGMGYHLVQPGESLNSIARVYNLDAKSLISWNRMSDPNKLEVCQKIWLSPRDNVSTTPAGNKPQSQAGLREHIVRKGESITAIARKYGVTESELRRLNSMPATGEVVIYPGQRLLVSAGSTVDPVGGGDGHSNTSPGPGASNRAQHLVRKNETVAMLARKYGYTTEYFRHINRNNKYLPLSDDQYIPEGQIVFSSDCSCARTDLASFDSRSETSDTRNPGQGTFLENNRGSSGSTTPSFLNGNTTFEYVGEYIVKTGDTMASIARQYGLTAEKLAAANNLRAGQEPQARDILKIPK